MLKLIVNFWWRLIYGEWSDERVAAYFENFHNIIELQMGLAAAGFRWRSDGLNFSIDTDTFERPGQVLARGWANCGGYMRLFEAYIKASGSASAYTQYELTSDSGAWHYISIIEYKGGNHLQSNIQITELITAGPNPFLNLFPEYSKYRIIDEWKK